MRFISKKTLVKIAVLAVLIALVPVTIVFADSPAFNIFPISFTGEQNKDFPLLDARNFSDGGSFSSSQPDHDNGVTADPGELVELVIYYHNGAANADENIAHNVRLRATLPSSAGRNHIVTASISADNASTVTSAAKGGDMEVKVTGTQDQRIEYISGSTRWFPNRSTTGQSLPDGIVSGGVSLGDIRGCWEFAGFVKFRARITSDQPAAGRLEIEKTVSNLTSGTGFRSSVDAQPSDVIRFKIIVTARDAEVRDVIIRDILPSGLTYRLATTRVDGVAASDSSSLLGSGYNFGRMNQNQTVEVTFEANVASATFFDSASRTLTNTANVRGQDASTVQDTALVFVEGQVLGTSFRLSKTAFNQTQGVNAQSVLANAGDIINYTLTYENTGNTTITNVVVEDDLSDALALADLVNVGEGFMVGNVIRFPAISVPAGVAISKTFQVRVRQVLSGQTDLTMTNIFGNRVDVNLRAPQVLGIFKAPPTGPKENIVALLSLLVTAAVFVYQKYPRWKLKPQRD